MAYRIPTVDELHAFVIGVARALLPDRDWSRRKPGWKWFRAVTEAVSDVNAYVTAAVNDLLPDTAAQPYLGRWGTIVGVPQKPATAGRGTDVFRVFGLPGGAVAIGDLLVHDASGLRFQVNENATIGGGDDHVDVDILALDKGSATRLSAGEKLSFDAAPPDIEEQGELIADIDIDGDDQEAETSWRARILNRFSSPPLGGAQNDYVQWALEVTGVETAYAYPLRQGLGSVDLAALHGGRGSDRLLSAGELTELDDYVSVKRPVSVTFRVLEVEADPEDVHVTLVPDGEPQFERDWDDGTPLEVASWTNGSNERLLQFTTDRPASMKVGDRIIVASADATGEESIIEAFGASDEVVLEEAPSWTPIATDLVYSGGPLVEPCREAIQDHFDELGPTNPDGTSYGSWEGNLRPANLYRACQGVEGVKGTDVIVPAAVVEPADNPYPDDGTVFLLTPGRILVRYL